MTMYAYTGVGAGGKTVRGVRDAESPKALRQAMRKDGVIITTCEVSTKGAARAMGKAAPAKTGLGKEVDLGGLFGGVKRGDVAVFTRQLATLVKAGIPLAESLGALTEQQPNERFKVPLGEVRAKVNEGSGFADALAKHPSLFPDLYVSMVRSGEIAGNLDVVLERLAEFLENSEALKSKVRSAMAYPVIMGVIGTGILALLMIKVVPQISQMFAQTGKTLPAHTQLLMSISNLTGSYWWLLLLLAGAAVVAWRRWVATPDGRRKWDDMLLRLPKLGPVVRTIAAARFSQTLGTMLASGVPMIRALDTAKSVVGNVALEQTIEDAKKAVTEGDSLSGTLKKSNAWPPAMIHMMNVGERAGQLEQMLERVSATFRSEVDAKLAGLTSVLGPLMIVVMGGIVLFVVFSILGPIADMGSFQR